MEPVNTYRSGPDEHGHFGSNSAGDSNHFVGGRHFEVQFDLRVFAQSSNVIVLNVTAIFSQVNGNSIRTAEMGFNRSPNRIRFIGATGLTQSGDVVDIDAEFDHSSCNSLKILRVSSSRPDR